MNKSFLVLFSKKEPLPSATHDPRRTSPSPLDLPTMLVQEGGYTVDIIGRCAASAIAGFNGRETL
jgi:acetoin utilization deacetylase AcuC-like enzyme